MGILGKVTDFNVRAGSVQDKPVLVILIRVTEGLFKTDCWALSLGFLIQSVWGKPLEFVHLYKLLGNNDILGLGTIL